MKKNFSNLLTLALAALLFTTSTSCKKLQGEGRTVVEGQAVDKHTGKPVPFATLVIRSKSANSSYGFNTIEFEKEADAQGNFAFSFEASGDKNYRLGGGLKNRYYTSTDFVVLDNARRNRDLKLKMKPWAWARIKFINEPPYDTAWLFVNGSHFHDDNKGNSYFNLDHLSKDTAIVRSLEGVVSGEIIYRITKRGVANRFIVPFTAAPLDTTEFVIRY